MMNASVSQSQSKNGDDHRETAKEGRRKKYETDDVERSYSFLELLDAFNERIKKQSLNKYGEEEASKRGRSLNSYDSFRAHVKGLLGFPSGRKGKKFCAGIGVAICDVNDRLVHEFSKKVVDGDLSYEAVEIMALIEGFHFINTLGLKRITIVCGNKFLYQCVTGKWRPGDQNSGLATLLNQVSDLQRKLIHCRAERVGEKDVKFAIELARKAVISQTNGDEQDIITIANETCEICLENVNVDRMFSIHGCGHRYCFGCMNRHVEFKLHQVGHILPNCPHDGCKSKLKLEDSRKFLTDELFEIMTEASIPPSDKIYCPNPSCSALMLISELLKQQGSSSGADDNAARRCTKCHRRFCVNCKVRWHRNLTCRMYKELYPHSSPEDASVTHLASEKRWRQCKNCKNLVSLSQGCNHIFCRCGYEFCYACGAERKNNKTTCRCPTWDERMIIFNT